MVLFGYNYKPEGEYYMSEYDSKIVQLAIKEREEATSFLNKIFGDDLSALSDDERFFTLLEKIWTRDPNITLSHFYGGGSMLFKYYNYYIQGELSDVSFTIFKLQENEDPSKKVLESIKKVSLFDNGDIKKIEYAIRLEGIGDVLHRIEAPALFSYNIDGTVDSVNDFIEGIQLISAEQRANNINSSLAWLYKMPKTKMVSATINRKKNALERLNQKLESAKVGESERLFILKGTTSLIKRTWDEHGKPVARIYE